ncbi:Hypothetical Protein RradSPS_0577 [Rubrobacter radiotolerans]|uniref:Uncharacterized protein n=1 Tax=Rubrobacter radiotolerans TaxID=42256 RepID=A0A023X1H0_RUBRA|nr:hypothetical protein [Rubrobacter radiotolerans]AHY45860.1 Hypothetical Protein RradSPS_0577 [Rubrobacter radiotolerans]MDX5893274.1 hypothetical protein [Rubrobacter radiotolerans]SMC03408.1 conserved hypothetical protein [Rubrobacter radiotolerans DSM 5868]
MGSLARRINWKAVVIGWISAIFAGLAMNLIFRAAHYGLFSGEAITLTIADATALVTISMISGFLAHSVGGYVAGRRAGDSGWINGAAVAVLGTAALLAAFVLVTAVALATAGALVSPGDLAGGIPPADLFRQLAISAVILFLVNLAGGALGGALGGLDRSPSPSKG